MSVDEGSAALRRQLLPDKHLLSALALNTGGSVISLRPFSDPRSAKVAGTVMARRVSERAAPADCQVCDCVPDGHGGAMGHLQCHQCIVPTVDVVMENWDKFVESKRGG